MNILAVIAFVVALGFGIVAPAIPLFARAFGLGTTAVGLSPRLPFFLDAGFLLVAGTVGVVLLRTAPESPGAPAEGRPT